VSRKRKKKNEGNGRKQQKVQGGDEGDAKGEKSGCWGSFPFFAPFRQHKEVSLGNVESAFDLVKKRTISFFVQQASILSL
jgi:hypothetical protein